MSKLIHFTVEIHKADKRVKGGQRLVDKIDFAPSTQAYISTVVKRYIKDGYIAQAFETYVVKKNLIGGKEFSERYDTPSFCSPSSESFWSM